MSSVKLINRPCTACHADSARVEEEEIKDWMKELLNWEIISIDDTKQLQRLYNFANFNDALAFADSIGQLAEQYDHHPALVIEWGKCQINWWTHTIEGLHQNDFVLAAKSDALYSERAL